MSGYIRQTVTAVAVLAVVAATAVGNAIGTAAQGYFHTGVGPAVVRTIDIPRV